MVQPLVTDRLHRRTPLRQPLQPSEVLRGIHLPILRPVEGQAGTVAQPRRRLRRIEPHEAVEPRLLRRIDHRLEVAPQRLGQRFARRRLGKEPRALRRQLGGGSFDPRGIEALQRASVGVGRLLDRKSVV